MKRLTLNETARLLRENDNYIILTHKRPDGDTLGSGAALCAALRRMGKRAQLLRNPEATAKFLPFIAEYFTPEGFTVTDEYVVSVDAASLGMLPKGFPQSVSLCVDHHPSNTEYAENLLLDGERAACGEIILQLIEELLGEPTKKEADLLYVALSTDCGCFRYGNTDEHAFLSAARLAKYGADVAGLNLLFFRTFTKERIAIEGLVTSGFRYFAGGRITVAVVTREMVERTHATQDDMDELASLPGQVEGTLVSVLVKENDEGYSKLSLRSTGKVNVSDVCARFGGGGHRMAAGCELKQSPEEAVKVIVEAIEKELNNE